MDANMNAILARWGFRPIDSNGHPTADEPAPEPQVRESSEEVKAIAKKILESPDVKL